jgi:hypothetical protein
VNLALTARLLEFMYGPSYPELKICELLQDLFECVCCCKCKDMGLHCHWNKMSLNGLF